MQHADLEGIARKFCQDHAKTFVKRVGEGSFKQSFQVKLADASFQALKIFKAVDFTKRDQREIDSMLRCNHPSIARIVSVDTRTYDGQQYVAIIEEFLPGGTLASKGRLNTVECRSIGEHLIDAIAHIAALGLVHRDIKPENIMFREDGITPVITDFGVARDLLDSSITPSWAPHGPGTPFFASPEQLNNQKDLTDWRSDQFSLGIVLAFATLGDHAFRATGISDRETVERVLTRDGPAEWFLNKAHESILPTLIRMVAPWPVDRYRTPEILARAWRDQKG